MEDPNNDVIYSTPEAHPNITDRALMVNGNCGGRLKGKTDVWWYIGNEDRMLTILMLCI